MASSKRRRDRAARFRAYAVDGDDPRGGPFDRDWRIGAAPYFLLGVVLLAAGYLGPDLGHWTLGEAFWFAVVTYPISIVNVRARLRDMGRSASDWWLTLIPFYNLYFGLRLLAAGRVGNAPRTLWLFPASALLVGFAALLMTALHRDAVVDAEQPYEPASEERTPSSPDDLPPGRRPGTTMLYDKSGNPTDVDDDNLTAALASSEYFTDHEYVFVLAGGNVYRVLRLHVAEFIAGMRGGARVLSSAQHAAYEARTAADSSAPACAPPYQRSSNGECAP